MRGILTVLFFCLMARSWAQGCSDAGVCTAGPIGAIATNDSTISANEPKHSARVTFSYAVGERGVVILQLVPQLDLRLSARTSLQARMPWMSATGDLGSNSGIGDPVITGSYRFHRTSDRRLDGTLGVKLPANHANAEVDGKALPMPYQTSLGTMDLLAGISYLMGRWQGAIAYQHVLAHDNRNEFTHPLWMDDMRALGYFESRHLRRANDAVARLQHKIPIGKLVVQPGMLAIQHLGRDARLEVPMDPSGGPRNPGSVKIVGSEGLTLNLTLDARYRLGDHWSVLLAYGSPVITREVRPDGLTRSQVLNVALVHHFSN